MQSSDELVAVFAVSAAAVLLTSALNLASRLHKAGRQRPAAAELAEVIWVLVPLLAVAWIASSVLIPAYG